jgi:uncharacterized protein
MQALMPALVLAVTLALLLWFHRHDRRNFERFRAIEDSRRRQRIFLRGALKGAALYLAMPAIGLALIGRIEALWHFPREFAPLLPYVLIFDFADPAFLGAVGTGVAGGLVVGAALLFLRRRRPAKPRRALDFTPMVPRNRAEMLHILPLILNAGVSEEVCFRLHIPLLITLCGAPAWAGFLAASALFGWLHRYQGWLGILTTGLIGAVLAYFYLGALSLAVPIALHLLANLNALILRPAIQRRFRAPAA